MKGMAQAAQSLVPSWGMFAVSPAMLHPPEAAPWPCSRAVSPGWPQQGTGDVPPAHQPAWSRSMVGELLHSWMHSKAQGQAARSTHTLSTLLQHGQGAVLSGVRQETPKAQVPS